MASAVTLYRIDLDRDNASYWAGERVTGRLALRTSRPIDCRGVRLRFEGRSYVHWHTGSGDNRTDYHGRKNYVCHTQTVWGNFYRTALLDNAGADALFGQSMGDGDVAVPLEQDAMETELLVRVMDYDFGVRDDLLGEVVVDVSRLLSGHETGTSFPLLRNGRPEKGEVTLSATVDRNPGAAGTAGRAGMLRVRVHKSTGLRKADMFGRNDVYVQMWPARVHSTRRDASLPVPKPNMTLPPGDITVPFDFQLPDKLPPSAEMRLLDRAFVRYSLYSNIDIKWRLDPSVRRVVTVFSSELPPPQYLAPASLPHAPDQVVYGCDCCCFKCCDNGVANVTMSTDRRALNPSGTIYAILCARNETKDAGVLRLELVMTVRRFSDFGRSTNSEKVWEMHSRPVAAGETVADSGPMPYTVPIVPGTYGGGAGSARRDPMVWQYSLRLRLDMPGLMTDPECQMPVFVNYVPPQAAAASMPQQYGFSSPPNPYVITAHEAVAVGVPVRTPDQMVGLPVAATDAPMDVWCPEEDVNNYGGRPTYQATAPQYGAMPMMYPPPRPTDPWMQSAPSPSAGVRQSLLQHEMK